jgi:hypothetical protein
VEYARAQIELAFARFPRLETKEDAFRLFLAEDLLARDMTPRRLTQTLGFDPNLLKYDPNEPREPKGRGRVSGEWARLADAGGTATTSAQIRLDDGDDTSTARQAAIAARSATFLESATPEIIVGLARLIARVSVPTAVLGALLIPTNRSHIQEGEVPGLSGVRYRYDRGMGSVEISTELDNETYNVVARGAPGGLLIDGHGRALGRILSSGIYLDRDEVAGALGDALAADRGKEKVASELSPHPDEPKACPDPGSDRSHGSKKRALDYEEDVHERVNPLLPLQRGQAVKVWNPNKGDFVYFDDCFRDHGDLIDWDMKPGDFADAKGEGYEHLLRDNEYTNRGTMENLFRQAYLQAGAMRPRGAAVKWYFAEKWAADYVREQFDNADDDYSDFIIQYMPARKR